MVVSDGDQELVLVCYDLLGLAAPLERSIRERLARQMGTAADPACWVLTTTHTHSGPATLPLAGESPIPETYAERLAEASVQAVAQARAVRAEAHLARAAGVVRGLTYNRRQPNVPPTQTTGADEHNQPSADEQVVELYQFRDAASTPLGNLLRLACHPVCMTTQHISADFPGELTRELEQRTGSLCLFVQGASGDINPTTVSQDHAAMQKYANALLAQIRPLMARLQPGGLAPIRAVAREVALPYAPFPDPAEVRTLIARNRRILAGEREAADLQPLLTEYRHWRSPNLPVSLDDTISHWARIYTHMAERTLAAAADPTAYPPASLRLVAWRMGDLRWLLVAAEPLAAVGAHLEALRPGKLRVVGYGSPLVGYLCDPTAYAAGGYEPDGAWRWLGYPGPFQADVETAVLAAARQLLEQLEEAG